MQEDSDVILTLEFQEKLHTHKICEYSNISYESMDNFI